MAKLAFFLVALFFVAVAHSSEITSDSSKRVERAALDNAKTKLNKKFHEATRKFELTKNKIDELLKEALIEVKAKAKDGKELAKRFGRKLKKAARQLVKEIKLSLKSVTTCAKTELQQSFALGFTNFIKNIPSLKKE